MCGQRQPTCQPFTAVTRHRGMLEKSVEQRLVQRAKQAGGIAIKWTSPAMAGVPDRIVFLPKGRILFVELKAPGKKPTVLQERVIGMLQGLGADVRVCDSMESVDELFAQALPG